ncbi:hypothetical protein BGZ93_008185 [Podila epicladia]|nr:hypothetical protein BGZ92_009374 [Podila epicladia]KAG0092751.1 hypothetical protein BGZ93_008185 [Podila epicladia]
MRSLSTFAVLLLAMVATLAMLSYTGATPIDAPSTTDVQDRKSDPPSVNDEGEYFVPIKDGGEEDKSIPVDILDYDDDDDDHKKCYCYWKCRHGRCWKVCRGKWCH